MNDPTCDRRDGETGERCGLPAAFALIDADDPELVEYACRPHREAMTMPRDKVVYIEGHPA